MICELCNEREGYFSYSYSWPQISSKSIMQRHLCSECFAKDIENRVVTKIKTVLERYSSGSSLKKIGLCFSGGKDSAVMLHIIAQLMNDYPNIEMSIISIDEGSENNSQLKSIASNYSERLGIKLHYNTFENRFGKPLANMEPSIDKLSEFGKLRVCDLCTNLKSFIMHEIGKENEIDLLLDGGNIDDKIAGFIQNMMSPEFLVNKSEGSEKSRIPRISVMDSCTDEELDKYSKLKNIEHIQSSCKFSSESMIKGIKKSTNELENNFRGFKYSIYSNIRKLDLKMSKLKKASCGETDDNYSYCQCGRLKEVVNDQCPSCKIVNFFNH